MKVALSRQHNTSAFCKIFITATLLIIVYSMKMELFYFAGIVVWGIITLDIKLTIAVAG